MTLKINDLNKLSGTEKNNLTFFLFCEIFESCQPHRMLFQRSNNSLMKQPMQTL